MIVQAWVPRAVRISSRESTCEHHCEDARTPSLKGTQCTASVTHALVMTVAMLPKCSQCIKGWVRCCAMFADTEPFTTGEGATYTST